MIELIQAFGLITTFIGVAKIHSISVEISKLNETIYYQRRHIAQLYDSQNQLDDYIDQLDYYQKTQKKRRYDDYWR